MLASTGINLAMRGTVRAVAPMVFCSVMRSMPVRRTFFTIINQYERAVCLTLGKLTSVKNPGIRLNIPILQEMHVVDIRTKTTELAKQDVITSDNVSIMVDAILYYRVADASKAVLGVQEVNTAVADLAKVKLRELLSQSEVNTILHQRERFSAEILKSMKVITEDWGIEVQNVNLKDISFDAGMQRAMAKKAEAERLREAKIIHAESEVQTAAKLLDAARQLEQSPTAVRLRELDTLQQIAKENNHSSVFIPISLLDSVVALNNAARKGVAPTNN
eukprot:Phypoly_transcript_13743.p1 GENE.Phypoly_transcript_13743~~Phypoly_transcript_13743.p1  ORF type:complete len:276 (+),score=30.55 Phypoly_transcript_13743:171-998(+)